jgi:hypothetical protein
MGLSIHRNHETFVDRRSGRYFLAGELIVVDSDADALIGDVVRLVNGQLVKIEDPGSDDSGNGARVVGVLVQR